MITENTKTEIQGLVDKFCNSYASQAKAVDALKNVSEATVINIRKGKWDSITNQMWLNVGRQVGYSAKGNWQIVKTEYYNKLTEFLDDAKDYSNVLAICSPAGSGKTLTAEHYAKENQNVYHIVCAEYMNRKVFLARILEALGEDASGSVSDNMDTIIRVLRKQEAPLIILDEADKLTDSVLYFFITLYNMLQNKCGLVMLATEYLAKRINDGRRKNKKGYTELFSRLGRKFISIKGVSLAEVTEVCKVNGLSNQEHIHKVFNEFEGDLRRVERIVHKHKKLSA